MAEIASLAQKYAHSGFSSSEHSLLPRDNLFKNIIVAGALKKK